MSNDQPWSSRLCRAAIATALCGALAACAGLAGQPAAPQFSVPQGWNAAATSAQDADPGAYWQQLDDPLADELIAAAFANNRDLAASIARLDQARAALRQARAAFLPTLSAGGSAARDIGDLRRSGVPLSLGIDASWEADLFGRLSGSADAAAADLAAQGYALADLQRLIAGQVASGTINARALAAQLAIARDTLAHQEENLQLARWRNQAGLVSSLDVEQARAQRAQTAASIPALEASLAATANALSTLAGEPPGRVLGAVQADVRAIAQPPEFTALAPPAAVLARRPDVRGAETNLVAASARIGVARAQLLPLLRLSGSISTGPVTAGNLFDIVSSGIVASISQLLFDGGRSAAQVDSAQAAARAALAQWEQAMLAALEDVETASADRRSADARAAISAEAVDAATNSALLARSQYEAGLTDFQTLLSAENQLLSARNSQVAAHADRALAFIRLTQALGGGWRAEEIAALTLPASDETMP